MYLTTYSKYANRTRAAHAAMYARGYTSTGYRLWSEHEDALCRAHYPDYRKLEKLMPDRTLSAIKSRCRHLGIQRKVPPWTGAEHTKFRTAYRTLTAAELDAQFPRRSRSAMKDRARKFGLARPKTPYRRTGNALFDELRSECFRQNITMPELDEFARSKTYFSERGWHGPRGSFKYQAIINGIHALGGKLSVTWEDDQ